MKSIEINPLNKFQCLQIELTHPKRIDRTISIENYVKRDIRFSNLMRFIRDEKNR